MDKAKPLVSIALCTYNGEQFLAQQLDSIVFQDYPQLEVVIVDDCSTDGTLAILAGYASRNPKWKIIRNDQNIGFNKNFNKAISLCNGTYIAIADQDDIWLSHKISLMVANVRDRLLLYHNSDYIYANGDKLGTSTRTHHRFVEGECAINLWYYNCVSGHACLFHESLFKFVPPFPENFYYDWWLTYTAACTGKIGYLENSLVLHRLHTNSATTKDTSTGKQVRLAQLKLFNSHPLTPSAIKPTLQSLINEYETLRNQKFSLKLLTLLIANSKDLFYIRKKSLFSRLKFILRECTK